jgi:hypothetical protein
MGERLPSTLLHLNSPYADWIIRNPAALAYDSKGILCPKGSGHRDFWLSQANSVILTMFSANPARRQLPKVHFLINDLIAREEEVEVAGRVLAPRQPLTFITPMEFNPGNNTFSVGGAPEAVAGEGPDACTKIEINHMVYCLVARGLAAQRIIDNPHQIWQ